MMPVTRERTEEWLRYFAALVTENEELLTLLDSAIGDADHGTNLRRGMAAVVEQLDSVPAVGLGATLQAAGMTLVDTVGGASGPLYGTLFMRAGAACGEQTSLTAPRLAHALRTGINGVQARGRAELGDKTMVDVLVPAIEAMESAVAAGASVADAASTASRAAEAARDATATLEARRGRASYLGERTVGYIDPGAASSVLLFSSLAAVLAAKHSAGDAERANHGHSGSMAERA